MEGLVKSFLRKGSRVAVVGVSRDPGKYGYKVYFDLKAKGFRVYAVNPNITDVEGDKVYGSVSDLPVRVDFAIMVVPPSVGIRVVEECLRNCVMRVWLQPGAESEEIIDFCKRNKMDVVYNTCIMVRSS